MSCDHQRDSDMWQTAEGLHLDVRGLEPPQPMIRILSLIDSGGADDVLIVHLDREPIFLYPELDDRGWGHELVSSSCGDPTCESEIRVRLMRIMP